MDEESEHVVGEIVTYESESDEESEYSDDDSSIYSSMLPLVPRSDSFADSDEDSADRNHFTFQNENSSSNNDTSSDDENNDEDDEESVHSISTAAVIRNIEEINMRARKQGCIQMYTHTTTKTYYAVSTSPSVLVELIAKAMQQ